MDGVRNHTINDPFNTTLRQTKNGINFCPQTTDLSLQRLILQVTIWKHHDSLLIVRLVGTPKQQQKKRKKRKGRKGHLSLSLSLSLGEAFGAQLLVPFTYKRQILPVFFCVG